MSYYGGVEHPKSERMTAVGLVLFLVSFVVGIQVTQGAGTLVNAIWIIISLSFLALGLVSTTGVWDRPRIKRVKPVKIVKTSLQRSRIEKKIEIMVDRALNKYEELR